MPKMQHIQYFTYGTKEINYLQKKDPILGSAMGQIGLIQRPVIPDLFTALVKSIVGQQISTKAQATIWGRIQGLVAPFTPANLAALSAQQLQACGLSMRKVLYIQGIAQGVLDGSLNLDGLPHMSDEDVCRYLCQIKGVGQWTAEMLMIFSMQRPDILSQGDLAILRGLRMLYRHRKITPKLFNKYKRRYSPHGSVASLYLWAIAGGAIADLVDLAPKVAKGKK